MKRFLLLFFVVLSLAGCAVNTRYVSYTDQQFLPKTRYYFISIYPEGQMPPVSQPYRVIGRVEAQGLVGDGVNSDSLTDDARSIARAKGADAIINARTESATYGGTEVIPGHCGYRHCRPTEYVSHEDTFLRFRGELITFMPSEIPEKK